MMIGARDSGLQIGEHGIDAAGAYSYDLAGNVLYDGLNQYRYDAEGRLCALASPFSGMVGYVYDAAGTRVARGSLSQLTCDFNPADSTYNGFTATTSWVLGSHGEQITEYAVGSGASTWTHTNIFAAGALLAKGSPVNTTTVLSPVFAASGTSTASSSPRHAEDKCRRSAKAYFRAGRKPAASALLSCAARMRQLSSVVSSSSS